MTFIKLNLETKFNLFLGFLVVIAFLAIPLSFVLAQDALETLDIPGCTDPSAINHKNGATTDDDSCVYNGCTDPLAENFDPIVSAPGVTCEYADPEPVQNVDMCPNMIGLSTKTHMLRSFVQRML